MGKSYTYHVIGFTESEPTENQNETRRYEVFCMNKMEMAQKAKTMKEKGTPIIGWFAQTKTGCRMLGKDVFTYEEIQDKKVKHIKLVECPICNGRGKKDIGIQFVKSCFVCNGSGITKNNYWNGWQDWQLDSIRTDFA